MINDHRPFFAYVSGQNILIEKIFQDLFVADGQGLPRSVVEKEANLAQQVLDLYAMKVGKLNLELIKQLHKSEYFFLCSSSRLKL